MTVQTHTKDTLSVYREALAREGMRFADGSSSHEASSTIYLQIADNAVESRRLARAQLALARTEDALLVDSSRGSDVALTTVRDARRALVEGDHGRASSLIQTALGGAGD